MSERVWASNTTIGEVAALLRRARSVAITTHTKPDGDAVGSSLALARTLERLRIDATLVYCGPWPQRFNRVVEPTPFEHVETGAALPRLGEPDAVVVVDTGTWSQLREIEPWLKQRFDKAVCIDHHRVGSPEVAAKRLIEMGEAAASEIVAKLCVDLLEVPDASALPAEVAEPLYLGVASDTGWFRHSNVTPATLRLASELLSAGVDHSLLFQRVEQGDRVERLRLISRALGSLEMHEDGRIALMRIGKGDFEATGATQGDTGGFAEIPLSISTVRVSAALTQVATGEVKVSFRSKSADGPHRLVDVNDAASALGGGGHVQAAGVRLESELPPARDRVLAELRKRL